MSFGPPPYWGENNIGTQNCSGKLKMIFESSHNAGLWIPWTPT